MQTLLGTKLKLAPGSSIALDWGIHAVRKGGTSPSSACTGPPANLVPIGVAMNKGLTLRMGQRNVKRYMPHLLEHVRAGRSTARPHHAPVPARARARRVRALRREGGRLREVRAPPRPDEEAPAMEGTER